MIRSRVSRIQEQFLTNSRIFEKSSVYNVSALVKISGELDIPRLRRSWEKVWNSAAILSSTFAEDGTYVSQPQTIPAPWEYIVCPTEDILKRAAATACLPLPLDIGPLARFILFQKNQHEHYALIIQHHSITDLFSKTILADAIEKAYANESHLPFFEDYSIYTDSENAYLASAECQKAREYFAGKIETFTEALKLPHSSYRPTAFQAQGQSLAWSMELDTAAAMQASEKDGKIPFLILLSAYAALLHRISGTQQFLIGVPFTNRRGLEGRSILGPCVNILPTAFEVGPDTSLADLYEQARREMLLNHRHQSLPFTQIANASRQKRDPARPFFLQAGFTNESLMGLKLEGLCCESLRPPRSGAQMDLFFTWWQGESGWEGNWEYNSASFCEADIRLWMGYFNELLKTAILSPKLSVRSIGLIESAWADRLSGANQKSDYPLRKSMAQLLRESMAKQLDKIALRYRGQSIHYADFTNRVACIATTLYRAFGQGGRIMVLLERSPHMLYVLHGIVHSGNAYVPAGIDWPQERIRTILEDVEPSAVICSQELRLKLEGCTVPVLCVEDFEKNYSEASSLPEIDIDPEDSMYIFFTSGTTGKPKGADLMHRGIVNRLLWMQDQLKLREGEKVLLNTPYTFDVSVWQLFWPLLTGATLVIAEEGQQRDPRSILRLIEAESVNVANFVPSMMTHFLACLDARNCESLRDVVSSGEALPLDLARIFFQKLPRAGLLNCYGPTEASIDVTAWACSQADLERGAIPIGRPISNTQVYILDKAGYFCPPLVEGEIFLTGIGLARSYWKRPDLSDLAFLKNPFGAGKMYKTGDSGRYGLDGAIEYLGRKDDQLKIRGIRVESGEIENCAKSIAGVKGAALKKGAAASGEECLILYYVSDAMEDIDPSIFRTEISKFVPASTLPEYYVRLEKFPMSENGKLNRKALAASPPITQATIKGSFETSMSEAEILVAAAWREVLGLTDIEHSQNFFDSGGHSLSLLKLRSLLEDKFRREIAIADLFARPTVSSMADFFGGPPQVNKALPESKERASRQRQGIAAMARARHKLDADSEADV